MSIGSPFAWQRWHARANATSQEFGRTGWPTSVTHKTAGSIGVLSALQMTKRSRSSGEKTSSGTVRPSTSKRFLSTRSVDAPELTFYEVPTFAGLELCDCVGALNTNVSLEPLKQTVGDKDCPSALALGETCRQIEPCLTTRRIRRRQSVELEHQKK